MTVAARQLKAVNRGLRQRLPIRALARQVNARARRNGFNGLAGFSQSPMAVAVRCGLRTTPTVPLVQYDPPVISTRDVVPAYRELTQPDRLRAPVETMEHYRKRIKGGREYR